MKPMSRAERIERLRSGDALDVLVIGGGIAGAGIALEAAHAGARVALVEANDFASGTSSRSSKLVHGGLRYLKQGRLGLTRESVRERNALLRAAPGLVEPLPFLLPFHADTPGSRHVVGIGLAIYDAFAGQRTRAWLDAAEMLRHAPVLASAGLRGGWRYLDATTDDARLTLRVLLEAECADALCLNYARVTALLRDGDTQPVRGVRVEAEGEAAFEVSARCVINATGCAADALRGGLGLAPRLRPLRGSHLLFPAWRLPVAQAVALFHPDDARPVYAMPWEGATLVGTTDLDHQVPLERAPSISHAEVAYLMRALHRQFPSLGLRADEALCSWSGVRPVVSSNRDLPPSQENREHLIVSEHGLTTVSGGKLTTFRSTALQVLEQLRAQLPMLRPRAGDAAIFATPTDAGADATLPDWQRRRWRGRYGDGVVDLAQQEPVARARLGSGLVCLAELRHVCRHEQVLHLDDLLLRRTRIGLTEAGAGEALLPELRDLLCSELGWDASRWDTEHARYRALWSAQHALPSA